MSLYECQSYKQALKILVQERKKIRKSVTFEAMALHCGVQKTYLSKVLSQKGNLSTDQLYLAAEYLKLTTFEFQFLENLFLLNTSNLMQRKAHFQQALDKARREILKSENTLHTESTSAVEQSHSEKYYMDPFYQLIHIFLTIDTLNKDSKSIPKKLGLSEEKFSEYVDDLLKWKIIEFKNGRFNVLKNNLHLSKDSHLNTAFRNATKLSAITKMNQLDSQNYYSFSAIISCDHRTKEKIQKRFLDFLKASQSDVIKSNSEEVYQINFDLLKWS